MDNFEGLAPDGRGLVPDSRWDTIVGSWAASDHSELEEVWDDVIGDLGSD